MAKYQFSDSQRYAIFTIHKEKCYLCSKPLDLSSMQVDHVVPENLNKNKLELDKAITSLGLDKDFNVNDYPNWLPSCGPCNRYKKGTVFEPSGIIQLHLQNAKKKALNVKKLAEKVVESRQISKALFIIKNAFEEKINIDEITSELSPLIPFHKTQRDNEMKGQPIKITPWYEVLSDDGNIKTIRGPYGIGGRPSNNAHSSFDCPNCGPAGAWNGAICVNCGQMDED